MKIEWAGGLVASIACVAVLLCLMGCAATVKNRTGDTLDVSQYPTDIQGAYKVFAVRCSRCHTLARPLNARINTPQQWTRYVARMRLNPASGINEKNGEVILRFLLYYMEQRNREREQEGGSGDSSSLETSPASLQIDELPVEALQPTAAKVRGDSAVGQSPASASSPTVSSPSVQEVR